VQIDKKNTILAEDVIAIISSTNKKTKTTVITKKERLIKTTSAKTLIERLDSAKKTRKRD